MQWPDYADPAVAALGRSLTGNGATDLDTLDVACDDNIPRHAPHPMPGTWKPTQQSGRDVRPHVSYVVVGRRRVQGNAQDLGGFFLDLEHGLRLFQPSPQPGVFVAQLLVLDGDLVTTPPPGSPRPGQRLERPFTTRTTPLGQLRGIQHFATQQSADFTWGPASIRLLQDAKLISGGEPATLRTRRHLRIRPLAAVFSNIDS